MRIKIFPLLKFNQMKNLIVFLSLLVYSGVFGQVPQAFNYQGIARDANGAPIINSNISLRITLKEGGTPGLDVYKETHFVQTNKLGLFSLEVGRGTSTVGVFQDINWGSGSHFIQIEIDPAGGSNFVPMGVAQLLAVPYALYAGSGTSQWIDNDNGIHYNEGNVGIGTSNPTSHLSIEDSDNIAGNLNYITLNNTSLGDRSGVGMLLSAGDDQTFTTVGHHSETYTFDGDKYADFGQLRSTGKGLIIRAESTDGIIKFLTGFTPNNSPPERMRITADGLIGIGTEAPQSNLAIVDSDNLSSENDYISLRNTSMGNRSGVSILMSAGDDQNNTTIGHHAETYNFDGDKYTDFGQVRSSGRGLILRSDDNNSVIKFLVGNTNSGTIIQERMRITATGNVGVGTETPASKLQVTNGDVFIENINNGVIMKSPNGNCWRVTVDNTGALKSTAITCPN
jgi:hypothetical protein